MLKIRIPDAYSNSPDPRMFFDINGDRYKIIPESSTETADILITLGRDSSEQNQLLRQRHKHLISIDLDLWHGFENQITALDQAGYKNNRYAITVAEHDVIVSPQNVIKLPWSFNRSKAFYSQFPFSPDFKPSYWNENSFAVPRLTNDASSRQKIFLAPCRTYFAGAPDRELKGRRALVSLIREQYMHLGYLGNVTPQHQFDWLYPQAEFPDMLSFDHERLDMHIKDRPKLVRSDWASNSPPHNAYYTNTFISLYGETVEYGSTTIVTEKTWDPLIKGHFVLPFSNSGFIAYLKTWNLRFPEFIDYSYDSIEDQDQRIEAWLTEVNRLMALPIDTWRQHWQDNLHSVLHHNQLVINSTDYRRVDLLSLL